MRNTRKIIRYEIKEDDVPTIPTDNMEATVSEPIEEKLIFSKLFEKVNEIQIDNVEIKHDFQNPEDNLREMKMKIGKVREMFT
jgi:hypothetical protein